MTPHAMDMREGPLRNYKKQQFLSNARYPRAAIVAGQRGFCRRLGREVDGGKSQSHLDYFCW